jgi:hypothetical protein
MYTGILRIRISKIQSVYPLCIVQVRSTNYHVDVKI